MFKKLFTNDQFFLVSVILTVVGVIPFAICCYWKWPAYSYMAIIAIINAISVVALYGSYQKHSKNVMKGLIGFILMGLLSLTTTITFPLEYDNVAYTTISLITFIVVLSLCINHFVINSDHHSQANNITINQMLLFVMFVLFVILAFIWIKNYSGLVVILYMLGVPVTLFGLTSCVVCVESRLDAYRIDREKAGWSEEAGYPEGYIHQKDRH